MLQPYRQILAVPGARAFCLAGVFLRLPQAMYPVALVLLVSLQAGDYRVGGLLTAAFIIGGVAGNPTLSRIADRAGQRAVLLPSVAAHLIALGALVTAVQSQALLAYQVAIAFVVGLSYIPAGALVRTRWAHLLHDSPSRLGTALSLESTFDEITYVVGPVLATFAATMIHPAAPFAVSAVLLGAAGGVLHVLRSTVPPRASRVRGSTPPLPRGVTTMVVLVATALGVTLVSVDLGGIAYAGQAGHEAWTGAVLACFALGSGFAGLLYGARAWRTAVEGRLIPASLFFALLPCLLLAVPSVAVLAVLMLVVGLGTAPLLITLFGVMERVTPPERMTEAMAWVTTGLNLGAGLAAPVVGVVADVHGARAALAMPLAAAVVAGLLGLLAASRTKSHLSRTDSTQPLPV